jgi:hypothetical protein
MLKFQRLLTVPQIKRQIRKKADWIHNFGCGMDATIATLGVGGGRESTIDGRGGSFCREVKNTLF